MIRNICHHMFLVINSQKYRNKDNNNKYNKFYQMDFTLHQINKYLKFKNYFKIVFK